MLTDLLNMEQSEIDDTRQAEHNASHNFTMLKQFLEDKLTQDTKVLKKANTEFAAALAAEKIDLAEVWKRLVSLQASHFWRSAIVDGCTAGTLQKWCHLRGVHQGVDRTSAQIAVDCWLVS